MLQSLPLLFARFVIYFRITHLLFYCTHLRVVGTLIEVILNLP